MPERLNDVALEEALSQLLVVVFKDTFEKFDSFFFKDAVNKELFVKLLLRGGSQSVVLENRDYGDIVVIYFSESEMFEIENNLSNPFLRGVMVLAHGEASIFKACSERISYPA